MKKRNDILGDALYGDYMEAKNRIAELTEGSDAYYDCLKDIDNLRNELLRYEQIKCDKGNKVIDSCISIADMVVKTASGLLVVYSALEFDKSFTITNEVGRPAINGFIQKLFKK